MWQYNITLFMNQFARKSHFHKSWIRIHIIKQSYFKVPNVNSTFNHLQKGGKTIITDFFRDSQYWYPRTQVWFLTVPILTRDYGDLYGWMGVLNVRGSPWEFPLTIGHWIGIILLFVIGFIRTYYRNPNETTSIIVGGGFFFLGGRFAFWLICFKWVETTN